MQASGSSQRGSLMGQLCSTLHDFVATLYIPRVCVQWSEAGHIVRSKLDYGCIVYGTASNTNLRQLDSIHNAGLRLAIGAFCTRLVSSVYTEANEAPLEEHDPRHALVSWTALIGAKGAICVFCICSSEPYLHLKVVFFSQICAEKYCQRVIKQSCFSYISLDVMISIIMSLMRSLYLVLRISYYFVVFWTLDLSAHMFGTAHIGLPRCISRLQYRLTIKMIIDDLWQNSRLVKSVDWLDWSLAMVPLILTRDGPTKYTKMAQIIKKLGFKIQNWHEDQH